MSAALTIIVAPDGAKITLRKAAWEERMSIPTAMGYLRFLGEQTKRYERKAPQIAAMYAADHFALMGALQEAEKIRDRGAA